MRRARWSFDRLPGGAVPTPCAIIRDQIHIGRRSWRRPEFGEVRLHSCGDDRSEQVGVANGIGLCVDVLAFRDRDGYALSDPYGEDGQVNQLGVGNLSRRSLAADSGATGKIDRHTTRLSRRKAKRSQVSVSASASGWTASIGLDGRDRGRRNASSVGTRLRLGTLSLGRLMPRLRPRDENESAHIGSVLSPVVIATATGSSSRPA